MPKALWNFPLHHTLFTDTDDMFLSVSLATRGLNLELLSCTVTSSWIDLDLCLKLNIIKFTQFAQVTIKTYFVVKLQSTGNQSPSCSD